MYEIGQRILYGIHGICEIIAIESMRFGRERAKYYCLRPVEQPDARYYVPVNKPEAVAKLRPLMDREGLLELLHSEAVHADAWIPEDNLRKNRYRELLGSGERGEIIRMIHTLHRHKQAQLQAGRKFHQCDENFLHDAQKVLTAEFSQVFSLSPDQVGPFIAQELGVGESVVS